MKKEVKSSEIKEIALNPVYMTIEDFKTLENQGLLIVDDDERNEDWKVYHILKEA